MRLTLPYGKTGMIAQIPDSRVKACLRNSLDTFRPAAEQTELVRSALARPIGAPRLATLAADAKRIVVISSDHTRPLPSAVTMPLLLEEIRLGNPNAEITILIATGCHRKTTVAELERKFGRELCAREHFAVHDCADKVNMVDLGALPSGGPLRVNRLACEADLLVAEGFIEPHFFAGFSGGGKSILPGVAAKEAVFANHSAAMIDNAHARVGVFDENPIHRDIAYAADRAGLRFILNVVANAEHEIVGAFAGHANMAHLEGVAFLRTLCTASYTQKTPIVITTNNGYPLDQNIYQAVKGMTTAEAVCLPGGVIIAAAECADGHGGEAFYHTFTACADPAEILARIQQTPREETQADQWQAQILARIMAKFTVILVSGQPPALVRAMGLLPASDIGEALATADRIVGAQAAVTVIPCGVSTIPKRG